MNTLESQYCFHSICNATYHKDFLIALSIFLSIYNIVYHSMRQLRSKGWPGFRFNISTHGTEIIIRIRTNKFHRIVEVFSLESRIRSKFP